jgi:acyl carrier protein
MIDDRLKRVILDELSLDDYPIDESTLAMDVPGWDSLNHAMVIAAVEKAFGTRFEAREVIALKNIGDLDRLVREKTRPR